MGALIGILGHTRSHGLADARCVAHTFEVVVGVRLRDRARRHDAVELLLHVAQARIQCLHVHDAEGVRIELHVLDVVTRQEQRVRNTCRVRVRELGD
eukprot:1952230-Prymnesium_polylepis.1